MAEDLSAKIDAEWEALQLNALRMANRIILLAAKTPTGSNVISAATAERDWLTSLPPVYGQIIAAVIGTFSPAPLGVDDFIGALAVANANAGEDADAVQSPPVFGKS